MTNGKQTQTNMNPLSILFILSTKS